MTLTGCSLAAYEKAAAEGRVFWRVADQYGRSCNGGSRDFALPPSSPGVPGGGAPPVEGTPELCVRGYHATTDPLRWQGCTVSLVEVKMVFARQGDKVVCRSL